MADPTDPVTVTRTRFDSAMTDNRVDGALRSGLTVQTFEYGTWNTATRTFTVLSGASRSTANCVHAKVLYGDQVGSRLNLSFASILGMNGMRVSAETYMQTQTAGSASVNALASSNVWFAGQPSTATAVYGGDITYASASGATQVVGGTFNVTPGTSISITSTGSLSNTPSTYGLTPDGDTGWTCNNWTNNTGGLSNCTAPINAALAVFISDSDPTLTAAPSDLDFTTATSRDYTSISPQLKQVFFIGDGYTSSGTQQTIVVPPGATRLYLGSLDPYGWWNNGGSITATVKGHSVARMVR